MAANVTSRQLRVLRAVRDFSREHGYMPSLRELAHVLSLAFATVRQHLDALKARGWLRSDGTAHGLRFAAGREAMLDAIDAQPQAGGPLVTVSILGTIAAGRPIEAIAQGEDSVALPAALAKPGAYALRVRGSSMIDDHILDGDLVVVAPAARVENGQVAVALLEDGTATLKRVYRERSRVRLQPANAQMQPIYVKSVRIQGRVTGIVRLVR